MRHKGRFRPALESLEERWCPAKVQVIGDVAYVTQIKGPLTLTAKAGNKIQVTDNVTNVTVGASAGVAVTGTSGANAITVDMNGQIYSGGFTISSLAGADTITFKGAGTIQGDVSILSSSGGDQININTDANVLDIAGSILAQDTGGNDVINLGTGTAFSQFSGNVTLTGFNTVNVSDGTTGDRIGGNLTISNSTELAVALNLDPNLQLGQDLAVTLGASNDAVSIDFTTPVDGDVIVNLGNGNNALTVVGGQQIKGNLLFTGGAGNDSITLGAGAEIGDALNTEGDVTLNMGDGTNNYTGLQNPFVIRGSLTINAGSGNDNVVGLGKGGGEILEDLTANLGNGNNKLNFGTLSTFGGDFAYTGGDGVNTVTNNLIAFANDVTITVGKGSNTALFTTNQAIAGDLSITTGDGTGGNKTTLNSGASVGGTFRYRGGDGGDQLFLNIGSTLLTFDALFGSGNDTIDFNNNFLTVAGVINGDGGTNQMDNDANVSFFPDKASVVSNFT